MGRSTEDGAAAGRRPSHDLHPANVRLDEVDGEPLDWLQRTIETEIVPRLMLAHAPDVVPERAASSEGMDVVGREDVATFVAHVLRDDVDACAAFVDALRERGVPLDQVYLDLIAPSARRLGTMWEADSCDFAQVTLGLWRMQSLVFDLSPQLPQEPTSQRDGPPRALLAAAPGSQHTLGLLMVSEFFRRAGWEVWSDPAASAGDLAALVRSEWFDIVGMSVGMDAHVAPLESVILALRRASRNPAVGVMVGGPILSSRPKLVDEVRADFSAVDAKQAVELADAFVSMRMTVA